ncbi:MAG: DUF4923 family protein [Lachnospiraceae bacterium]|nr:DUF4923 family protein [Lachnospiraceae bacterium]
MTDKKLESLDFTTGILTLIFTFFGGVLFAFSYSTSYYTFGTGASGIIMAFIVLAVVCSALDLIFTKINPDAFWVKLLTFGTIGFLAASAILLIGDRVEGIGNTIITDYDAGHGGEEAIYYSIASAVMLLIAMVLNIIGAFSGKAVVEVEKLVKKKLISVIASAVCGCVVMVALFSVMGTGSGAAGGSGTAGAGEGDVYTISYNQNNNNIENLPEYQFLTGSCSGLVKADSRFYVDVTLTLFEDGTYNIYSDAYVIEQGKRAEVGDSTGLGLVFTMNANGTYTDNGDGTVTTSVAESATFEMETDTYSVQMKPMLNMKIGDSEEDGVYTSDEYGADVLDLIPETIFVLEDGAIVSWDYANPEDAKEAEEEAENADSEDASSEEADGEEADSSEDLEEGDAGEEEGEPAVTLSGTFDSSDGATTITFNEDGTYVFAFPEHNIEDPGTYTYDGTTLVITNANGQEITAEGSPLTFTYVSSLSEQLTGEFSVTP